MEAVVEELDRVVQACRSLVHAIQAGDRLTPDELEAVVEQIFLLKMAMTEAGLVLPISHR
jgi:hypothetical protein